MSRNGRSGRVVARFNNSNPPPDEATANRQVEDVTQAIAQIESDLDFKEVESFETEAEYEEWRHRAIAALAKYRAEIRFLERWLQTTQRGLRPSTNGHQLGTIARDIRAKASAWAGVIASTYRVQFTPERPPLTLDQANSRMSELIILKQRIQQACATINQSWTSHPLSRRDLPGAKAPLQSLLASVEIEISVVRRFRRSNASITRLQVLTQALDRAMTGGFELTTKERRVYSEIMTELEHTQS